MNILLINPPWTVRTGNIWNLIAGVVPPLGLAQLAAYLEQFGLTVTILDTQAERISLSDLGKKLAAFSFIPDFIGLTATTSIIRQATETAHICKNHFPSAKIVLGGVHPSIFPRETLSDGCVDFVIRREGEESFHALVSGTPPAEISGLSFKLNGTVVHNKDRDEIPDINKLPMPAYHLLPMDKYRPALGSYKQLPGIGIVTTRGCPGKCTFCFGNYLGMRVRMRSADNIFKEISLLHAKYGIREISFYDDTFTAVKSNVLEFCILMEKSSLNISWSCFARVDFIDETLLTAMKAAGCHQICFGVESGSEEILNNIKKKTSLNKAKQAVELTKKFKIEARTAFMLGNPGETAETMRQTLDFALKLDSDIALFNVTTPYPGTEMFTWADEHALLKTKDWSKYDLSHQILDVPGLTQNEIQEFYNHAYKAFYLRPSYLFRRLLKITNIHTLRMCLRIFKALFRLLLNPKSQDTP